MGEPLCEHCHQVLPDPLPPAPVLVKEPVVSTAAAVVQQELKPWEEDLLMLAIVGGTGLVLLFLIATGVDCVLWATGQQPVFGTFGVWHDTLWHDGPPRRLSVLLP